jgi:secondary thiamine-phosphate synthase enzyme
VRELTLKTSRSTELIDITQQIKELVSEIGTGTAALVYVPHTTAALTINEKIDPVLVEDLEEALTRLSGDPEHFRHDDKDGPNGTSHLRSTLVGPQQLIPIGPEGLALGTYQAIFFCEFDGPRDRRVLVTTLQ